MRSPCRQPLAVPSRKTRTRIVLGVLFCGAFAMGCAEMQVVGLLDLIATDLEVPLSSAGALVTTNAVGLAVGGPLLAFLTARLRRRSVVLAALATFVALNLVPVLATSYPAFLAARVGSGAAQGLYIAAAITTATRIVPPGRAGRAMAVVISGFASASALGLPLGTLLGQAVGWRGSFVAIVAVGAVVLVLVLAFVPPVDGDQTHPVGQARHALAPRVLAVLAVCLLTFTAVQSALTYLVPFLADVSRVSGSAVGAYLLAYGVATTVGSSMGGRFADGDAAGTLVAGTVGVTVTLVALRSLGANPVAAGAAVIGMGLFAMGMAPSMQHRVVELAGPGAPLASSLPSSAVNVGIALGSWLGGFALDRSGVPATALAGALVGACAVAAAWSARRLEPPALRTPEPATENALLPER